MMIDLIGGPSDGDSIPWERDIYPGMMINVMHMKKQVSFYDSDPMGPAESNFEVLRYQIERVLNHVAFAKHVP